MTIFVLDLAIEAVNHQLAALILGNVPRPVDRILFTVEVLGVALGTGAPNGPSIVAWNDVLIAFGHV